MPVKIHGKMYRTVEERVNDFHEQYSKDVGVETTVVQFDEAIAMVRAVVTKPDGKTFSGHAFERSDGGGVNSTSHLENAETSAVGRALAFAGFSGGEIASANEVEQAIAQKSAPAKPRYTDDAPAGPLAERLTKEEKPAPQKSLAQAVANVGLKEPNKAPDKSNGGSAGGLFAFESDQEVAPDEASDKQLWKLRGELRRNKISTSPSFELLASGTRPKKRDVSAEIEAVMAGEEPKFNASPTEEEWADDVPF